MINEALEEYRKNFDVWVIEGEDEIRISSEPHASLMTLPGSGSKKSVIVSSNPYDK